MVIIHLKQKRADKAASDDCVSSRAIQLTRCRPQFRYSWQGGRLSGCSGRQLAHFSATLPAAHPASVSGCNSVTAEGEFSDCP